jgi:hypothetical protein
VPHGNPKSPPVHWRYRILPYARPGFIDEFQSCQHLIVVGVTNDQIAPVLRDALQPNDQKRSALQHLKKLDVYYASDALFGYMPKQENLIVDPDAVQGNPDRSIETLTKEKKQSIAIVCELQRSGGLQLMANIRSYSLSPIAAIVAGDFEDKDRGVIQVTHYIWGRTTGSCPTMVLRPKELREVYNIYADYLRFLEKNSERLECTEEGTSGPG